MGIRRNLVVAICMFSIQVSIAKAAYIYNTLPEQPAGYMGVGLDSALRYQTILGVSFKTTADLYVITSVTVPILNYHDLKSGTISLSVYDENQAKSGPKNKIGKTLGTLPVDTFPRYLQKDFTISNLSLTLSPSTNYYLMISGTGLSDVVWTGITKSAGTTLGSRGLYYNFYGGGGTLDNTRFAIGSVNAIAEVPEPSGYFLCIISLGFLAFHKHRKARPQQS